MVLAASFFIQRSAVARDALMSLSSLPTSAELERGGEGGGQLRVYRYDPGLAALPLADVEAGELALERQVAGLQYQRLRDPETGALLDQEQKPRSRVRRRSDQGLDLVGLEVLR